MGRQDRVLKKYFRDKRRFADLFNGSLFEGEQVNSLRMQNGFVR